MTPSSSTRVFAILGDPVGHSLSPRIQNAGFQAAGLDAVYVALRPQPGDVAAQLSALAASGGGGNVTIPYKQVAARIPGVHEARVDRLGVANVFGERDGELHLGNTDVDGILAALKALSAPATAWCVIGTGGSARAVVGAAAECGARVAVRSRDPRRAEEFQIWAGSVAVGRAEVEECEVLVNATPLGMSPSDLVPIDAGALPAVAAVLDLVYRVDGPTAWVKACNARGLPAADGREVLLAQGAASWRIWFPGVAPPLEVMRAALDGRLV